MVGIAPRGTAAEIENAGRRREARILSRPPLWREFLLIAVFYTAYTITRLLLSPTHTSTAYTHAEQILAMERSTGLDVELRLNEALVGVPWLARITNVFYASAHFAVTLTVLIWLWRRRPLHYRWLRGGLMTATAMALVGFWAYPLAPPRFLPSLGYLDPVVMFHTFGLYSAPGSAGLTNQYAAMPSIHAGWSLWCGLILVTLARRRWVRALGAAYPVVTTLVIVATANHYLLDAVAGAVITLLALTVVWYARRLLLKEEPGSSTGRAPT